MTITTVRPNATAAGEALFTKAGGAATAATALADDSDATFISKATAVAGAASVLLDFGTTTIGTAQRVKRVRMRARVDTPNDTGRLNFYLGSRIENQNFFHSASPVRGEVAITTIVGPWQVSAPNGTDWNQASINGLRGKFTEYNDSTNVAKIYEAYIDIDIATQPTVTVSNPTGTITTSAAPDVIWAFTDPDGETQSFYEIKVYSAAQYGAGGFSPNTTIPIWGSGEVGSTDNTAPIGKLLTTGTYRAYVRAAKSINGQPFWSPYAFSQFTLSFTPPTVPTLLASWSAPLGRATLTVTGASLPGSLVSQYYEVERSDDGGITYRQIRNGTDIIPNVSFVGTAQDYEAPRDRVVFYRARAIGVDSNSNEFPTAYSTAQQVLITNDATWWFKVVNDPTLNQGSIRVLADLDVIIEEPNTIFRPLGADRPIVVAGPLQGEDGIYNIKTVNETEWNNFYPILNHQGTILVQDPLGNQKYVRITRRNFIAETAGSFIHRNVDASYVEVED
jgi:hypothetical protein